MKYSTREEWLIALTNQFRPVFAGHGYPIPDAIRFSCGFPSRRGLKGVKSHTIGQCWSPKISADGHSEILISPTVSAPMEVAAILAHELVHAAVGVEEGHKGPFRTLALAIGLEGKMTATHGGEQFVKYVGLLLLQIGAYPHGALDARAALKVQSTRNLKLTCPECGYRASTTRKWLEEAGAPLCPTHEIPLEE